MIIAPYSFDSLPIVTRAEVAAMRRGRALATFLARADETLTDLLKVPVRSRIVTGGRGRLPVAVGLAARRHTVMLAVETALAREVVARALSHPPRIDSGKSPDPALQGAFAAVLVHALRRAGVAASVTKPGAQPAGGIVIEVQVDGAVYEAVLDLPEDLELPAVPPRSLDFPIALPLVAIVCLATPGELAALDVGDVFMAPGLATRTEVALVSPSAERGIAAEMTDDGRVVVGKDRFATQSWEPPMSETNNPTLEVALEAPVVVRVELGAVEMKAREWASLAEGDVIRLQRKLGEPAILRIAGAEVARGELVQVDGEYGIRITSIPLKGIR